MADRRRRIELLLATRFDLLYHPNGSLRTSGGFAPGAKRPCPDCGHTDHPGVTVDSFKRSRSCVTCGGSGSKPGTGYVWTDRMDVQEAPVGDAETKASARPRRTVRCDACDGTGVRMRDRCVYCDGEGRRDLHAFDLRLDMERDPVPTPLESAIARRDEAGSYHELDLALAGISRHVNKPLEFWLLTKYHVEARRLLDEVALHGRDKRSLTGFDLALYELALAYLDLRMPDPVRVPRDVLANVRELETHRTRVKGRQAGANASARRDREIVQHARRGRAAQWIAAEYGLHVSTVYAIVKQADDRERQTA